MSFTGEREASKAKEALEMGKIDIKRRVGRVYRSPDPNRFNKELNTIEIDGEEKYILHYIHWNKNLEARDSGIGMIFSFDELERLGRIINNEVEIQKEKEIEKNQNRSDPNVSGKEDLELREQTTNDDMKERFIKDMAQQKSNGPVTFGDKEKDNVRRKEDIGIYL